MQTVRIYGIPRSGTNLLSYVLMENFHDTVLAGEKHGYIMHGKTYKSKYGWPNFIYNPITTMTYSRPTCVPFQKRKRGTMFTPEMIKWIKEQALCKELDYDG